VQAEVLGIEYDPNRSARIALIKYSDGELSYILAPDGLRVGARVMAGNEAAPDLGTRFPCPPSPLARHSQHRAGARRGGQIARSAGQQATLNNREGGYGYKNAVG